MLSDVSNRMGKNAKSLDHETLQKKKNECNVQKISIQHMFTMEKKKSEMHKCVLCERPVMWLFRILDCGSILPSDIYHLVSSPVICNRGQS